MAQSPDDMADNGQLELTTIFQHSNATAESAVPKDLSGRKQSSSKKFKIESVAAQDDPLYNSNAPHATGSRSERRPSVQQWLSELPSLSTSYQTIPQENVGEKTSDEIRKEGVGGEVFHSIEDINIKPRTLSNVSNGDQSFYSAQDLDSPSKHRLSNGVSHKHLLLDVPHEIDSSTSDLPSTVSTVLTASPEEGVAKPNPITRRGGTHKLQFDDSFYKKATVEMRSDKQGNSDDPDLEISVPVPGLPSHEEYHETINSAYETNISINKLLRERHKGSLAAMGRFFGSKQKEEEKRKTEASIIKAAVVNKPKTKKCYQRLRPIHFCLVFTFLVIISATVVTLVTIESSRAKQFSSEGYHLDYRSRELFIYEWTTPANSMSLTADVLFKAYLGVNISPGLPNNCTKSQASSCYRWHDVSEVIFTSHNLDNESFCLDVQWTSDSYNPMLEDCIDINPQNYGYWYGGHINRRTLSLGKDDINFTMYLPGEKFGHMAERLWLSTSGMAIVANHDFPLHLRVDAARKRLCLSSWYGYQVGRRKLSYSVCRANDYNAVRKLVLDKYYQAFTQKNITSSTLLDKPLYSVDGKADLQELLDRNISSSYIIDKSLDRNIMDDLTLNQPVYGLRVSPYTSILKPFWGNIWLASTDMDVPRLFNLNGIPHLLLNASIPNLTASVSKLDTNASQDVLLFATNLASGDIRGQEYYAFNESTDTFQPFVTKVLSLVTSANPRSIMSSVVSANQKHPIVTYLEPTEDIGDRIRRILHSSMLGYNFINAGEIPGSLSDEQLIRILQLSIFLPVTHISSSAAKQMTKPEVAEAWETCIAARKKLRSVSAIVEHVEQGDKLYPLYAPIWWRNDRLSENHFDLVDQFIFDDQYLVAPIINASATKREVVFPPGEWYRQPIPKDLELFESYRNFYKGNQKLEFEVAIGEMLVFKRVEYH
ncbi:SITS-binding protein-like isoform X2 [Watersipora subatra]|uniref:SITS-binding protein-like isoform X2 n=1 Tax=Watersipora subatra TaxID=2589382 RepID=UPI00355BF967